MEKFLKFGLVGIFNTLITIISYIILVKFGMNYLIANIISYLIGVANSYYWNKNWVFQSNGKNLSIFLKFLIVNLIVLAFNTFSLFILVDKLLYNEFIAQIFAIGIGMMINFFLNKIWTFNQSENSY
ncbi:gtrA-like family protein [Bacillus pseudomycoides]|uniref:GtrA family protein n=1 Tax=Bacillus TaxID=1386 RepID=UPI000365ACC4|nr:MULTISPECIES: GtrA family protein [Bacillus]AIK37276.1 gtrA-like family protein [Bacillus pseudomycoides]AJI17347.1 gtrA-like family protein [Bacillus pseudomycoides]MEB3053387.1 GtrA family protein [Bacillus pseudomycoides]MED4653803.1 GtrA family protein [Bacillus pseudomycoides]PEE03728.1 GtrA family protein [Bacillus pseudomycoides]